jgi:predicted TIM-barrel fold metal-dependent hydrolase
MQDPEEAASELTRCVTKLGFKGALISGTINDRFLDDPVFEPVLAEAEKLGVPLYLHPAPPPAAVYDVYFRGLPADIAGSLATSAWGWHVETGLHCLRLVAAGVFDRFPKLQIIIGHMGENLPFSLARADNRLTPFTPHLQRRVRDYFLTNFHITTSAYFTLPPLLCALMVFGVDRILFSVDYPFSPNAPGRALLDTAPLSPADLEKIAHGNAERLLKL